MEFQAIRYEDPLQLSTGLGPYKDEGLLTKKTCIDLDCYTLEKLHYVAHLCYIFFLSQPYKYGLLRIG